MTPRPKPKEYALHPGYITTKTGAQYFIGFSKLRESYRLPWDQCVEWDRDNPKTYLGRDYNAYIHLHPDPTGEYKIP